MIGRCRGGVVWVGGGSAASEPCAALSDKEAFAFGC